MATDPDQFDVTDNTEASQYEVRVGDQLALLAYELRGASLRVVHTEVPGPLEGQGIAGRLTRTALDDARKRGLSVVPLCSYARYYIQKHPEYQDLVEPPYRTW